MNPVPALTPHLKQLRLSGILDSLEARNRQAIESKLAYTEFLALLIDLARQRALDVVEFFIALTAKSWPAEWRIR